MTIITTLTNVAADSFTNIAAEVSLDVAQFGISATFTTSDEEPKMFIDRLVIKGNLRVKKVNPADSSSPPISSPPASSSATATASTSTTGAAALVNWGPNLSGMEWSVNSNFRRTSSTQQFMTYNGPRNADFQYLAQRGVTKVRLPVPWEMMQPILSGNPGSATATVISDHGITAAGDLHPEYMAQIDGIYSAAAANGIKILLDVHSYCRYIDFNYGAGGVPGVPSEYVAPSRSADQVANRPYCMYTPGPVQAFTRIFSLNSSPSLTQAHFTDLWTRLVNRYRTHAANGGYGLMNEPNMMPSGTDSVTSGAAENLNIWPTYAQAAINAIRAIDTSATDHPIYVAGNVWNNVNIPDYNPMFPLSGTGLIYDIHSYLDARSGGFAFDYDYEFSRIDTADPPGYGTSLSSDTGVKRVQRAVSWATAHNVRLALTECGMPVDDPRWQTMFENQMDYCYANNIEVYMWMGGNHWPTQAYAINSSPQWHQNKTLPALVEGAVMRSWGIERVSLFDYPTTGLSSGAITVRVSNRGYRATPLSIGIAASGGILSTATITLSPGANTYANYTWTPAPDSQGTITYSCTATVTPPSPRTLYSYSNPVALASTNLSAAANAIIGKYNAVKWEARHAYTDYLNPAASAAAYGSPVRAISDSGYASQEGNAFNAINFVNKEGGFQAREFMQIPVMESLGGKPCVSFRADRSMGLWCKKVKPTNTADDGADAMVQPNADDKIQFSLAQAHFMVAGVAMNAAVNGGVMAGASRCVEMQHSYLALQAGTNKPMIELYDRNASAYPVVVAANALSVDVATVVSCKVFPNSQKLRVNRVEVASAAHALVDSRFDSLHYNGGYHNYYITESMRGVNFGVIIGAGSITDAEIDVLEQYIQSLM